MTSLSVAVLAAVALATMCSAQAPQIKDYDEASLDEESDGGTAFVAARIVVCGGCGLARYPKLRAFVTGSEVQEYGRVEVSWQDGQQTPELEVLDKYGAPRKLIDLSGRDAAQMHAILKSLGFARGDLSKAVFVQRKLTATRECIAWHQTAGCSEVFAGHRTPVFDASCHRRIAPGRAGYCLCAGSRADVHFNCHHDAITCADVCKESDTA
jgi:hypothetical protein